LLKQDENVLIRDNDEHLSEHFSVLNATISTSIPKGIKDITVIQTKEPLLKEQRSKSTLEDHK